jgi:hypothetical protein
MIRLVALLIFALGALMIAAVDGLQSSAQPGSASLQQRVTIKAGDISPSELVLSLRADFRIPISFIDAKVDTDKTGTLNLDLKNTTVADLLNRVVADIPVYRWEEIEGRLVLYPDVAKYKSRVHVTGISEMKRIEAVNQYLSQLREQRPEFANLLGPAIKGYPAAPLYSEPVSLHDDGTVLHHFVELLGNEPSTVFSIVITKAGPPMFVLDRIQ